MKSTLIVHPLYLNLSFQILLRTLTLYLSSQLVSSSKVLELEFITYKGMYVWISAMTTGMFTIIPIAA